MEIGKTYLVNSSRKGTFSGALTSINDEWATFTITDGKARAMLSYNEREKGEEVTVRRSFCTFTENKVEDAIDDDVCITCSGTGEGQYDGTRCNSCKGSGVEKPDDDEEDFDVPDVEEVDQSYDGN